MSKLQELTLQLIKEYISCAKYMCSILKDDYPTKESLLRARRLNIIPKNGQLSEGISFNFHGGGCYFEFVGGTIDIDFGPGDRCDGFDYYRLHDFIITSNTGKYKELHDEEVLKKSLEILLSSGQITNPQYSPNPHLSYLTVGG